MESDEKMNKLWLEDERKVFLSRFTDSSMGKYTDKYTESHDFWRIKTYTKAHDMLVHPRMREFEQPYQVAQRYCGGNWNDFNKPFTIQVGACNINCYFCFVGDDLKDCKNGKYFTAEEIVRIFLKEVKIGVFRISGGEPFLAPEFLKDVASCLSYHSNGRRFLWIDTNLLGFDYLNVVKCFNLQPSRVPYGICGCFKGFDPVDFSFNTGNENKSSDMLDLQFKNAKLLVDWGDIFFYIPEITDDIEENVAEEKISKFIERMQKEVHENAPLRTTVLKIKTYPTNEQRMRLKTFESGKTKKIFLEKLEEIYGLEYLWLPQNQIRME